LNEQPHILSIDLGTSGPKVALVALDGELRACAAGSVEIQLLAQEGAEQDPEQIWDSIESAARQVTHRADLAPERVVGVTIASQYSSVVPVDEQGRPLMKLILWMDGRGAPCAQRIYQQHSDAFVKWLDIHGGIPMPSGNDSLSHMMWVQRERPEVYEKTYKFLEPVDFVAARLTGRCASNPCTAFTLMLTDNRKLEELRYDDELIAMSGIDRDKLPELLQVSSPIGTVRDELAERLGLPPRTPVFSGTTDTQAVAVGTGVFRGEHGGINVGTTSQILAHVPFKRSDIESQIVSIPSPIPGQYLVMAESVGATGLDHFLRKIVFASDALGDHTSDDPFARLEELVRQAPAGCDGLLFLPWVAGAQAPSADPKVRGGFLNFTLGTTRAHMVRAILESLAFSMRWLLPAVERFAEQEFAQFRFAGGAALSAEWSQIMADVLCRPVLQLEDARHVINRATAFLGFEQLGLIGLDDIDAMCRVKQVYEPRAENREIYDRLCEQFVAAFDQNRPIFQALNE